MVILVPKYDNITYPFEQLNYLKIFFYINIINDVLSIRINLLLYKIFIFLLKK